MTGLEAAARANGTVDTSGASSGPQHVAIIMDGNGRWAKQRRRPRLFVDEWRTPLDVGQAAAALVEAERSAAAEQGRVQRERFLTPGAGYQPGNARMFNN